MKAPEKALARWQLDEAVKSYDPMKLSSLPVKGWIRAVRDALGMSARQLAALLKVKAPRITALEQAEVEGRVTIRTLRRAAVAMDCVFVYALLPRDSFEQAVRNRAYRIMKARLDRVRHSMALEDQKVKSEMEQKSFEELVNELVRKMPRSFWDEKP